MNNEKIEFLNQKPETLINYGKTVVLNDNTLLGLQAKTKKKQINKKNTEQILNIILPPIYFKNENNEQCYQKVLTTPSKICDVARLQKKLDEELIKNKARETGICPIREKLYSECLDELIREITINCSHRGIMLVRVRDELKNTIETYQKLYLSSLGLGVRTALKGDNEEAFLNEEIKKIKEEIIFLEKDVCEIEGELGDLKEREGKEIEDINSEYKEEKFVVQECLNGMKGDLRKVFTLMKKK